MLTWLNNSGPFDLQTSFALAEPPTHFGLPRLRRSCRPVWWRYSCCIRVTIGLRVLCASLTESWQRESPQVRTRLDPTCLRFCKVSLPKNRYGLFTPDDAGRTSMLCNYCLALNPDSAAYCCKCGREIESLSRQVDTRHGTPSQNMLIREGRGRKNPSSLSRSD